MKIQYRFLMIGVLAVTLLGCSEENSSTEDLKA